MFFHFSKSWLPPHLKYALHRDVHLVELSPMQNCPSYLKIVATVVRLQYTFECCKRHPMRETPRRAKNPDSVS